MTTSNLPESVSLSDLPALPREDNGPVFAEPWQAQAFALAVKLSEQGYFSWREWTQALGAELKAATDRGQPNESSRYYEHWLSALERLVTAKGLINRAVLDQRKNAWAHAYRMTPHGQPIQLIKTATNCESLP